MAHLDVWVSLDEGKTWHESVALPGSLVYANKGYFIDGFGIRYKRRFAKEKTDE